MNAKHEKFVLEYIDCENGAEAYRRAGYKPKDAKAAADSASRLLVNVGIKAAIEAGLEAKRESQKKRLEETEVDRSYVITLLKENVERAMQHRPVLDKEGVETGEYQYEGAVANKGLELLGKTLAMFTDKVAPTDPSGKHPYDGNRPESERGQRIIAILESARARRAAVVAGGGGEESSN